VENSLSVSPFFPMIFVCVVSSYTAPLKKGSLGSIFLGLRTVFNSYSGWGQNYAFLGGWGQFRIVFGQNVFRAEGQNKNVFRSEGQNTNIFGLVAKPPKPPSELQYQRIRCLMKHV